MIRSLIAITVMVASSAGDAQTSAPSGRADFDRMLSGITTIKLSGSCKRLVTPEGDQTPLCDNELINLAFASGNSSFIATMKGKGGITFRGRDSAAKGDVATLKVSTILVTGADVAPFVSLNAKGVCTYTNPNKGPVQVNCTANTDAGKYELSFVSDGTLPK
ncbi:MAG: hypothetical protein K2Y20_09735 [Sphingomonas sp.]|nr:hypothetical protein [Sphingomonas sp.]